MKNIFQIILQKIRGFEFGVKQQQAFLEDLSALVEDGVPVNRALELLQQISKGVARKVTESVSDSIARGQPLADGMHGWFSQATIEIVRAGERSGALPTTLKTASSALSHESHAIGELIAAVTYPLIVVIGALCVIVFIKHSVFESFAAIKPVSKWPSISQNFYYFADFIQNWWWFLVLVIIVVVIGINVMLRHLVGEARGVIDQIPLLSLYRQSTAARLMETLGILLQNGVAFNRSLGILQNGADSYLSWHLLVMEMRLSMGQENIADVLDTGLLDAADLLRLRVVAKGSGFEHALLSLGNKASNRINQKIAKVSKIFGALFLIAGGMMAAMMVLAIYTVGSSIGAG